MGADKAYVSKLDLRCCTKLVEAGQENAGTRLSLPFFAESHSQPAGGHSPRPWTVAPRGHGKVHECELVEVVAWKTTSRQLSARRSWTTERQATSFAGCCSLFAETPSRESVERVSMRVTRNVGWVGGRYVREVRLRASRAKPDASLCSFGAGKGLSSRDPFRRRRRAPERVEASAAGVEAESRVEGGERRKTHSKRNPSRESACALLLLLCSLQSRPRRKTASATRG